MYGIPEDRACVVSALHRASPTLRRDLLTQAASTVAADALLVLAHGAQRASRRLDRAWRRLDARLDAREVDIRRRAINEHLID